MTKIYTRGGDKGETSLVSGERVPKDCVTLKVVGEIDELNSALGVVVATLCGNLPSDYIKQIQKDLFMAGSEIATLQQPSVGKVSMIGKENIEILEESIDQYEKDLKPLTHFILPGGALAGAYLHVARTICRRVERELVNYCRIATIRPELIAYFNRLSDWLFVAARFVNQEEGAEEDIIG